MKKTILFLSIIKASGLDMITIYNFMIDSTSWGYEVPACIQVARNYYTHVDPRFFFQVVPPINQVLITLAIILFWKDAVSLRVYFSVSFLLNAIIAILTFFYFVPRDKILFSLPMEGHTENIKIALAEWR